MNVSEHEYILLLKIKGLVQAAIRVYAPTASDGLKHLFGAIQEDINRYETLHGVGNSGATAVDGANEAAQ